MTRHVLTAADRAKSHRSNCAANAAWKMRRSAEMALLDRLLAEAASPERYPHQ